MTWAAILTLAAGAYAFKAIGALVVGPLLSRPRRTTGTGTGTGGDAGSELGGGESLEPAGGWPIQLGQLLPPALLAALVVNQTVATGQELVIDARLAGVVAGALAVWRGAPFWLVLVIAAATTALLRLAAG